MDYVLLCCTWSGTVVLSGLSYSSKNPVLDGFLARPENSLSKIEFELCRSQQAKITNPSLKFGVEPSVLISQHLYDKPSQGALDKYAVPATRTEGERAFTTL